MLQLIDIDSRIFARDSEGLLSLPRIIRVGDFNEEAAEDFSRELSLAHRTGQPIIPVVIDSTGGDVYALWAMVDSLEQAKLPVATIIEGKAMSCAAVLFTCGTEGLRFIGPNATIMIHDVTAWSSGEKSETTDEIKANARETERLNVNLYAYMEKRLGKRKGSLWKMVHDRGRADWYLTPREAVKMGLANHAKVPSFRTTVSVDMTLEY
jgi:ATP-dependent Clp protease, protease subunit